MPGGQHINCGCGGACTLDARDPSSLHKCGRHTPCQKAPCRAAEQDSGEHSYKQLARPSNDVFMYDGSLAGFYCCVFESVYSKRIPADIIPIDKAQPMLLEQQVIPTEEAKSERVRNSLHNISILVLDLVECVYYSCMPGKELAMLRFILLAYEQGGRVVDMHGHPIVSPLLKAEFHLTHEAQLLTGFIRFSDYDGSLAATITPKNFVLPYIARHFVMRFSQEDFLIFDKTHKAALVYQNRKAEIIKLEDIQFPEAGEKELKYRALWKQFYHTIAIEARINPRCRMTHMPKRYWGNMLEVRDELK